MMNLNGPNNMALKHNIMKTHATLCVNHTSIFKKKYLKKGNSMACVL